MKKTPKQTITEFVTKVKEVADQLASIGELIEEEVIMRQILNGIRSDKQWQSFTTAYDLIMDVQTPDFNIFLGQLFNQEANNSIKEGNSYHGSSTSALYADKKDKKQKGKKKEEDEEETSQANFASKSKWKGKKKGPKQDKAKGQNVQPCAICDKTNHTTQNCWFNGKTQKGSGRGGYGGNRGRGGHNFNNNNRSYNRRDYNNYSEDQPHEDSLLLMNLSHKEGKEDDHLFYIDSGCSNHVAGNIALLSDLESPKHRHEVQTGDDTKHNVEKIGNVKASNGRTNILSKVLYVPTITKNLISVGQIVEKGLQVRFTQHGAFVEDPCQGFKKIA
ncbi:hypothetical protein KP509_34G042700 [Ceratopteris richardii]|uniref:Retrovirus-related Pol polyprotein from transposon TNT 1-94-like beta-barrel domain-containing protein n=1 Tax=Ceratopteris richardii TaxID=49495 RepID=A0A8T2QKT8_CERRI|nr:hypothetical protein KP509_34G042700 [Ceratopteris richardii]